MKLIKKLISVTMICVTLVSVTACGKTDRDEEAKKLGIETPVTINVWYDNKDYESYLNTVASGLKSANNLITVNPVYVEAQDIVDTIYSNAVLSAKES